MQGREREREREREKERRRRRKRKRSRGKSSGVEDSSDLDSEVGFFKVFIDFHFLVLTKTHKAFKISKKKINLPLEFEY